MTKNRYLAPSPIPATKPPQVPLASPRNYLQQQPEARDVHRVGVDVRAPNRSQRKLCGRQAQLLILIYVYGASLNQAAAIMELNFRTVARAHQRMLRVLRQELAARGVYRKSQLL